MNTQGKSYPAPQTRKKSSGRRRRRESNYYLGMILGLFAIVGLVVFLIARNTGDEAASDKKITVAASNGSRDLLDADGTIANGEIDEMLDYVQRTNRLSPGLDRVIRMKRIRDSIKVYRELVDRVDEVPEDLQNRVQVGLVSKLLQLHVINLLTGLDNHELRDELIRTAGEVAKSDSPAVVKEIKIHLTAIPVLDLFDEREEEGEFERAEDAIRELIREYPDDTTAIGSIYQVIVGFSASSQHRKPMEQVFGLLQEVCEESDSADVKELSAGFQERQLLVSHGLLRVDGSLAYMKGDDPTYFMVCVENFLESRDRISHPTATVLGNAAGLLEQYFFHEEALQLYNVIHQRIQTNQDASELLNKVNDGKRRLELVGQKFEFPEQGEKETLLVLFVDNGRTSRESMKALRRLIESRSRVKLSVIAVNTDEDHSLFERMIAEEKLDRFKVVHDSDYSSVYRKIYPARFCPSLIVVDEDGTVTHVNMSYKETRDLIESDFGGR